MFNDNDDDATTTTSSGKGPQKTLASWRNAARLPPSLKKKNGIPSGASVAAEC